MIHTKKTFPYEYALEESDVALVGIPFDSTETGFGVKFGPLFIREAIKLLPGYDAETRSNVFEEINFCDIGDVEVVPGSWTLTRKAIEDTVVRMLAKKPDVLPVFLGGEHLVTLAVVESLAGALGESITVVHFDAHRDLMREWMGKRFSHATWAYYAAKNPRIEIVQIGCRAWEKPEEDAFRRLGIRDNLRGLKGPVYVSVDMDVFDPAYAPEVGTPEPLGLSPEEFFRTLRKVCKNRVVGLDIVECASQRVNTQTAMLGANVFKKALSYINGASK